MSVSAQTPYSPFPIARQPRASPPPPPPPRDGVMAGKVSVKVFNNYKNSRFITEEFTTNNISPYKGKINFSSNSVLALESQCQRQGGRGGTRSPFPDEGLPPAREMPRPPGHSKPAPAPQSRAQAAGHRNRLRDGDRWARTGRAGWHDAPDEDAPPGAGKALAGIARGAGAAQGGAAPPARAQRGWDRAPSRAGGVGATRHSSGVPVLRGTSMGTCVTPCPPAPSQREAQPPGQGLQPPPQGTVPTPRRHCQNHRARLRPGTPRTNMVPRALGRRCPAPALPEPREGAGGGKQGPGKGQARNDNVFPKGIDTLLLLFNTTPYKTEAAAAILIEGPKLK